MCLCWTGTVNPSKIELSLDLKEKYKKITNNLYRYYSVCNLKKTITNYMLTFYKPVSTGYN